MPGDQHFPDGSDNKQVTSWSNYAEGFTMDRATRYLGMQTTKGQLSPAQGRPAKAHGTTAVCRCDRPDLS